MHEMRPVARMQISWIDRVPKVRNRCDRCTYAVSTIVLNIKIGYDDTAVAAAADSKAHVNLLETGWSVGHVKTANFEEEVGSHHKEEPRHGVCVLHLCFPDRAIVLSASPSRPFRAYLPDRRVSDQ